MYLWSGKARCTFKHNWLERRKAGERNKCTLPSANLLLLFEQTNEKNNVSTFRRKGGCENSGMYSENNGGENLRCYTSFLNEGQEYLLKGHGIRGVAKGVKKTSVMRKV
jgi:hypothetical protein